MTKIIALCGFEGSGKDTVANYMVEKYGYTKISFAKILKDVVSILFDWDRQLLEGETNESRIWRETIDEWWSKELNIPNFTPRYALKFIATDLFRQYFNDKIWLLALKRQIDKYDKIVISDCRFKNEFEFVNSIGGDIFHIQRHVPSWFNNYKSGLNVDEINSLHVSQYEWIRCNWSMIINNSDDIETTKFNVDVLVEYYGLM